MNRKAYTKIGLALLATMAVAGTASAQIVYQDSFNRTGSITITQPDVVDTNGNFWLDPSQGTGFSANTGSASTTYNYNNEYLPVNGISGVTLDGSANFTLSANITNAGTSSVGIMLAYSNYNGGSAFYGGGASATSDLLAQIGKNPGGGQLLEANGATTIGGQYLTGSGTLGLTYNASAQTIAYTWNGTTEATLTGVTTAEIQALTLVGMEISYNNYNSGTSTYPTVGNFELDIAGGGAVPEPSTYALMLAGLGFLVFVARRRARC